MARDRTAEEKLLAKRAREIQEECAARGEKIGYQQCLSRAAQERGKASYEAALAEARLAEALVFLEEFGGLVDLLGEAAEVYQGIVQKAHTDTASIRAASEALLQHAAQRRDIVGSSPEEVWRFALADLLKASA